MMLYGFAHHNRVVYFTAFTLKDARAAFHHKYGYWPPRDDGGQDQD